MFAPNTVFEAVRQTLNITVFEGLWTDYVKVKVSKKYINRKELLARLIIALSSATEKS